MAVRRWPKKRCLAPSKADSAADLAFLLRVASPSMMPVAFSASSILRWITLEGAGIGVVDAPLFGRERMFERLDLDPVIAERTGLVEPEGLQIAGHHLHRRDPAGLHGGDEVGALLEGRLAA